MRFSASNGGKNLGPKNGSVGEVGLDPNVVAILKKQGYHLVGKHSAVKPCLWLKKSLRGKGLCYKGLFYGIKSHCCVQMTPSIFCNQRCLHCWRPIEILNFDDLPADIEWDAPESIVDGCLQEQQRLISGYKGAKTTDLKALEEARTPRHAAISLIGEPTLYPHLRELVEAFHERGMTTFVVTNGTQPGMLRRIAPTQLYLSLNAPHEELYKKISGADFWKEIKESLKVLRRKGGEGVRTVIRVTCIEGLNMEDVEGYASLIKLAAPAFVEVKAYMHLGFSRQRLRRDAMPSHKSVRRFAAEIAEATGYSIAKESEISRVVLLTHSERPISTLLGHTAL